MTLPFRNLSFSSVNAFAGYGGCELSWYYDRIEKVPRAPKGPGLWAGSVWDRAVMEAVDAKIATGETPAPDLAAEALLKATRTVGEDEEYVLDATAEQREQVSRVKSRGPGAAKEFVTERLAPMRPLATQRQVIVDFAEVDWGLVGYIDIVEQEHGGVVVTDNKATLSSSRKFDQAKAQTDLQLALYSTALAIDGENVVGRGFRSVRILKTKAELGAAFVPSSPAEQEATLDLLGMIGTRMEQACETGTFLPTAKLADSWKCSAKFCDHFATRCPFGARARVQVAIPDVEPTLDEAA